MTKKVKRILGVIMGAAVMMAAAGCGQSADSGTKDAQEVKASEPNAENADSAQAESAEEVTGTMLFSIIYRTLLRVPESDP